MARMGKIGGQGLSDFEVTSNATADYNCVSWAVHHTDQAIWPDERGQLGWPPNLERTESVEVFQAFFKLVGFETCTTLVLEAGVEKIVLYAKDGAVTHVARQLNDGKWTSKMGSGADGSHAPQSLVSLFGPVASILRRNAASPPRLPPLHPPPPLLYSRLGGPLLPE